MCIGSAGSGHHFQWWQKTLGRFIQRPPPGQSWRWTLSVQFFIEQSGHLAPYAILLLVYLLLSIQSELLRNRLFAVPCIGALLLFSGFREAITPDLEEYKRLYESISSFDAGFIEPSFLYISKALNAIGMDYHALFVVYSFVTLLFAYLGIRNYTKNVKLSLLLYILIPSCFLNMFVEMREVCAIALVLYATSLLNSNWSRFRLTKCVAAAALSVSFHYSALIYWIIFVVFRKLIRRQYSTGAYLSVILSSLLIPTSVLIGAIRIGIYPFAPAKYRGFLEMFMRQDEGINAGQILKAVIYVSVAICFVLTRSRRDSEDGSDKMKDVISLNLFVIGVAILNLSRATAELSRLAYYFLIQQIVLFPSTLERINGYARRLLAAYCLFLFYLAQFAWGLFYYSPAAGYIFLNYRNVLLSGL